MFQKIHSPRMFFQSSSVLLEDFWLIHYKIFDRTVNLFPGRHFSSSQLSFVGKPVKVYYTDTRKAYSLHIGEFKAHRTFIYCPDCNTAYSDDEFGKIVSPYSNVGYEVIEFIGRLVFQEYHTL